MMWQENGCYHVQGGPPKWHSFCSPSECLFSFWWKTAHCKRDIGHNNTNIEQQQETSQLSWPYFCTYTPRAYILHMPITHTKSVKEKYILHPHTPTVLWHCWLGHVTRKKPVPDMTYNVFGGTLNLTQSYTHRTNSHAFCSLEPRSVVWTFSKQQTGRQHAVRDEEWQLHVPRELQWLPLLQRIHFKLGCLMYKSLSGQAPQYLADDVQLVADDVGCDLPVTEPVSFHGLITVSATEASLLLGPEYGMLYLQNSDMTSVLDSRCKLKSHLFVYGTQPWRIVTHCFLEP